MAEPVVLSGSSIATYLRCGLQWEFAYVRRIKSPPNVRQVLGIAAHAAVEKNMIQKITTFADLDTDEVVAEFADHYDREVADVEDPDEDVGHAKDSGIALVEHYQRIVSPVIQPTLVEEPVAFNINGIEYAGTIDLLDNRRRLRDLKTTTRKPSEDKHFIAMTGYALGYRHQSGEKETDVVLDYMIRRESRGLVSSEYAPVASGGPVNDDAIAAFTETVERVHQAIEAGIFVPTGPQNFACGWCGYRNICPAIPKSSR